MSDRVTQLRQVMDHLRNGEINQAQALIRSLAREYPQDADVWYAAALVAENTDNKVQALIRALQLNPQHAAAKRLLDSLRIYEPEPNFWPDPTAQKQPSIEPAVRQSRTGPSGWVILGLSLAMIITMGVIIALILINRMDDTYHQQSATLAAMIPSKGPTVRVAATARPTTAPIIRPSITPSPTITPMPYPSIVLKSAVRKIVVDSASNMAYGVDAANKRIAFIDLAKKTLVTYLDLIYVPSDLCIDSKRGQMFIVNTGSSFISAYDLNSKQLVKNISWPAPTYANAFPGDDVHFHIACQTDRLFVVDANWSPAPWIIPLDGVSKPVGFFEKAQGNGDGTGRSIGDFVFTENENEFYYWKQYGWNAGIANTSVYHVRIDDTKITELSTSANGSFAGNRDPRDTPIFYDARSRRIITKVFVLNAGNLMQTIYKFPYDSYYINKNEDLYAVDWEHGLAVSKRNIYSLDTYNVIKPVPIPNKDAYFFDGQGTLYVLDNKTLALYYVNP